MPSSKPSAVVERDYLVAYLDGLLEVGTFQDYCPNGLQVEGKGDIRRLASGVTACQALIEAAAALKADALLVHHGYFWKGEDPRITGIKRRRLKLLLAHGINLIAYHLPLDAHPLYGNNAQLARLLGIEVQGRLDELVFFGTCPPWEGEALARHIGAKLARPPLYIPGRARPIRTVAWCTGAGQSLIERAVGKADAYLTGEISEPAVHIARETGLHLFACGHHATERYGVRALGEHIGERFGIEHRFIDIDNPA